MPRRLRTTIVEDRVTPLKGKLAGAEGFEPSPSSLTVRCPTSWTTPQQSCETARGKTEAGRLRRNARRKTYRRIARRLPSPKAEWIWVAHKECLSNDRRSTHLRK